VHFAAEAAGDVQAGQGVEHRRLAGPRETNQSNTHDVKARRPLAELPATGIADTLHIPVSPRHGARYLWRDQPEAAL
jgi:hypothetical protein